MLEEVCVDLLVVRCEIRLDVVVELDDLEHDAFLLKLRFDNLENLGVRYGGGTDFDDFLCLCVGAAAALVRAAAAADEGKGGKGEDKGE